MTRKKLSRSVIALALAAAVALTGCDTADDDNPTDPGDVTTTSLGGDLTTTTTLAP